MDYYHQQGDEDAVVARLGPHFLHFAEPTDIIIPLGEDPVWKYIRFDLQIAVNRFLWLELEEDERSSARVTLRELRPSGETGPKLGRLSSDEVTLWGGVAAHPDVPMSMEVIARDLLLSTGADASPVNADRVIEGYRALAKGPVETLHVALAILRANTIARARKMPIEAAVRADLLDLAERSLATSIFPGISLRHVGAIVEPPRQATRLPDELNRLRGVLNHIEAEHHDASTIDWATKYRLSAADTEPERVAIRRAHVAKYLAISDHDTVPVRAVIWAERAVALAADYGIQDLHDVGVLRMQKLSRTDLGWHHRVDELKIPVAMIHQRKRVIARLSSWEQGLAAFLARDSPSGKQSMNKRQAAGIRGSILDLVGGRTFGSHQLPERTHGPSEIERLNKVVQANLVGASIILRIDLDAIADQFGIPTESEIVAFVSSIYNSSPALARPFANALCMYWAGDRSSAARLAIPLIEAGARELLFLMDQPLYRMERGASPGRFPAMDFYVDRLEQVGLDADWVTALRGVLLSGGMNLRNRLAHGFKLDFTDTEAALVLRLAGLFLAMPVGTESISDERARMPLSHAHRGFHRRLGWVWK